MGLYIDGIFDDHRMPLSGFIDLRLYFEDNQLTVVMPWDRKPYYSAYPARYIQIAPADGGVPQLKSIKKGDSE